MGFIVPSWKKRMLVPSTAAQKEMDREGLDLYDLVELLKRARKEEAKRKPGVEEYIATKKNRSYKIVLAESFQRWSREEVFLVIHVKSVVMKK